MAVIQGDQELETPEAFVERLHLNFMNKSLLHRALTHRSYLNEHPEAVEDNERLEFLGDAVLDFLVGAWLFNHFPEMREGDLTRLRAALVKTEQLSEFASNIKLGNAIRLGKGEGNTGGRHRKALLCAAFEALVGALYLDGGMEAVNAFVVPMLKPAVYKILEENKDKDPKSELQEIVQAKGYAPPRYKLISSRGPDHEKVFTVEVLVGNMILGSGTGRNKQSAEKMAANEALKLIEKLDL